MSILSELGEIMTPSFGGGRQDSYSQATIYKIKKNVHILQKISMSVKSKNSGQICTH